MRCLCKLRQHCVHATTLKVELAAWGLEFAPRRSELQGLRSAIVPINQPQQFNAFLSSSAATQVANWSVNNVAGGNSTVGTINASGMYTSPDAFPSPNTVMISAVLQSDASKTANASVAIEFPNNNHLTQTVPIKLGTTGGNSTDISGSFCCSGTLGSLWTRADLANPVILSNNHVLDKSSFGAVNDPIGQPGLGDNNCVPGTLVARMTQGATLKPNPCTTTPCTGAAPSNVDAAIAQIVPGAVDPLGNILDLGPAGTTSIAAAPPSTGVATTTIGGQVAKSGRTTGLACSSLQAVSNVQVPPHSTIRPPSAAAVSAPAVTPALLLSTPPMPEQ